MISGRVSGLGTVRLFSAIKPVSSTASLSRNSSSVLLSSPLRQNLFYAVLRQAAAAETMATVGGVAGTGGTELIAKIGKNVIQNVKTKEVYLHHSCL